MADNQDDALQALQKEQEEFDPLQYLYTKIYTCPVCSKRFVDFLVRSSKLRVINTETDNKTNYKWVNPNLYEIIFCNFCGYAALRSYFDRITSRQQDMIQEKITPKYTPLEFPMPLTQEQALERYRQAVACASAINAKISQKAILSLRMAWIYRDLEKSVEEQKCLEYAFEGLKTAFGAESFPIGGMDEPNAKYMIAELARRLGKLSEAKRWISDVVVNQAIPSGLRERALAIKELIREAEAKEAEAAKELSQADVAN